MALIYRRFHAGSRPDLLAWLEAAGHAATGAPPSRDPEGARSECQVHDRDPRERSPMCEEA